MFWKCGGTYSSFSATGNTERFCQTLITERDISDVEIKSHPQSKSFYGFAARTYFCMPISLHWTFSLAAACEIRLENNGAKEVPTLSLLSR